MTLYYVIGFFTCNSTANAGQTYGEQIVFDWRNNNSKKNGGS
jgi:hypothetical protein